MTNHNSHDQLRNLWQSQPSEAISMSVEELRRAARKFTRRIYWRNLREYIAVVVVVLGYGYYFFHFHTPLIRIGSLLVVAGALWIAWQLHRRGSPAAMPEHMDSTSCIDYHRAELARQYRLLSTIWTWYLLPLVPGLALFFIGLFQLALAKLPPNASPTPVILRFWPSVAVAIGVFVFVGMLNHWAARKLQRQIDALDALKQPPR